MCGIFAALSDQCNASCGSQSDCIKNVIDVSNALGVESEKRGKQSSGISLFIGSESHLFVSSTSFSRMIVSRKYKRFVADLLISQEKNKNKLQSLSSIGHARLVTHGIGLQPFNNQPISDDRFTLVHNGIVTNALDLKTKYSLVPNTQVDSEIILLLIAKFAREAQSILSAIDAALENLRGEINCLLQDNATGNVYGFTNTGSLFYIDVPEQGFCLIASERSILEAVVKKRKYKKGGKIVKKVPVNKAILFRQNERGLDKRKRKKVDKIYLNKTAKLIDHRLQDEQKIDALQRCTKCILPITFPGISFDASGVCNVCQEWEKPVLFENGEQKLSDIAKGLPRNIDGQNCLVAFSGGRDSSYGLYKLKELGFNPIAYTYDWGMVTNLARRNQARMCGALNIEHIWISADIPTKRRYVRQNLLAWLKRPSLGLVPLLMAGDKHLWWHTNRLKKETQLDTSIFCGMEYEQTNFKAQFLNVKYNSLSVHQPNSLNFLSKINLAGKYGYEFVRNPAYLNSSLLDTFSGFLSYYLLNQDNLPLFSYIQWDEDEIETCLVNKFNWELSDDSPSSWRIGDATAPLYNFIYYTVAGFTEVDTFRSNQIRDGVLSREDALRKTKLENKPQWENLKAYLDLINLDFTEIMPVIENMEKLY